MSAFRVHVNMKMVRLLSAAVLMLSISLSVAAPSVADPLRGAANTDLDQVDWRNFTVPAEVCHTDRPVTLQGGHAAASSSGWPDFPQITIWTFLVGHGDLYGNGQDVAVLEVSCYPSGPTERVAGLELPTAGSLLADNLVMYSGASGDKSIGFVTTVTPPYKPDCSVQGPPSPFQPSASPATSGQVPPPFQGACPFQGPGAPQFLDPRIEVTPMQLSAVERYYAPGDPPGAPSQSQTDIWSFNGNQFILVQGGQGLPITITASPTFGEQFSGQLAKVQATSALTLTQDTAMISWGDGSVTAGTLSSPADDPTELDVTGTHTYWTAGRITIEIKRTNSQTNTTQTFTGSTLVTSRYVAVGDSYSSGEGADLGHNGGCDASVYQDPSAPPNFAAHTDFLFNSKILDVTGNCNSNRNPLAGDGSNMCHRAITAYPHVVSRLLNVPVQFVACSGDTVGVGIRGHSDPKDQNEPSQLLPLAEDVSLVTVGFTGDDLGFTTVVTDCVLGNDVDCVSNDQHSLTDIGYETKLLSANDGLTTLLRPSATLLPPSDLSATTLSSQCSQPPAPTSTCALGNTNDSLPVHDRLVFVLRLIRSLAPGARIMVIGYPRWFDDPPTMDPDEHFSRFEQSWLNDRIQLLDRVLHDAADESGVAQYVDVYSSFAHNELDNTTPNWPVVNGVASCNGSGPFMNGVDIRVAGFQDPRVEFMHPNQCGHAAFAQAIVNADPLTAKATFSLHSNESTTVPIDVGPGLGYATVTAQWLTGVVTGVLRPPPGVDLAGVKAVGPPDFQAANAASRVFATWTLPCVGNPCVVPSGTWTLMLRNTTSTSDVGVVNGQVYEFLPSIPHLPPAGSIRIVSASSGIGCTATFRASVNPSSGAQVQSFTWYNDHGVQQTDNVSTTNVPGDTLQMSSADNSFLAILKTSGVNGQNRYTSINHESFC